MRSNAVVAMPTALCLLVVLGAAAAATTTAKGHRALLQDLQQQCFDAYNAAGGQSAIAQRVPACSQDNFKLEDCCSQAKSALAQGPSGCLCDQGVWNEVERQMTSSGIQGLTPESLRTFTRICNIPNKGAGTC
eukprot:GHUV01033606.1.p1 GENE.GHUV01033606.1~~GHUV01033606.1.p1  ORF type:complete len:133 (+),score=40.49 GHUV01033606.1:173-571(+)